MTGFDDDRPVPGPFRRDLLKSAAALSASCLLPVGPALAASAPDVWLRFMDNAEDYRQGAARRSLSGHWEDRIPVHLSIEPPASEAEIAAVERRIGEPLPKPLRQFYGSCSAGIDIRWFMAGREETTSDGITTVRYDRQLLPPPPFQRETQPWGGGMPTIEPTITGGHIAFSLKETAAELAVTRDSAASYRKAAEEQKDDPSAHLHYTRYAEWWERGFPLGLDGGGNMIAIDRQDEAGRMMWLAHDGADEPGWFIDHDLPDFMLIQSRLGFPGFGAFEFGTFSAPDVPPGERERRYLEERPGDVEAGLATPSTYRIDDRSSDAGIWREWLGLKRG